MILIHMKKHPHSRSGGAFFLEYGNDYDSDGASNRNDELYLKP